MNPFSFREVERKLLKAGFVRVGQAGSHIKYARADINGTRTTTVPRHREVAAETLRSILRQAGISEKEFSKL